MFNGVALDHEVGTSSWPNGADFDPATLHDWPEACDEPETGSQAWSEPSPNDGWVLHSVHRRSLPAARCSGRSLRHQLAYGAETSSVWAPTSRRLRRSRRNSSSTNTVVAAHVKPRNS